MKRNIMAKFSVTSREMDRFGDPTIRKSKLRARLQDIFTDKARNSYAELEDSCEITESLFRKLLNGSRVIHKNVLARFIVGLKLDRALADELFYLLGEPLDDNEVFDHITICAIRDKDDIHHYLDELKTYWK